MKDETISGVKVPWHISPSSSLIKFEFYEEPYEGKQTSIKFTVVNELGDYKKVELMFSGVAIYSIIKMDFDYKKRKFYIPEIPQVESESYQDWKKKVRMLIPEKLNDLGYHLLPRFYQVNNSKLLMSLNLEEDCHYIILGHDCYVEVTAEDFDWRYID